MTTLNAGINVEKFHVSYAASEKIKWYSHWKISWQFLKKRNVCLPYDPTLHYQAFTPEKWKLTVTQRPKRSFNRWILNGLLFTPTTERYWATKRKKRPNMQKSGYTSVELCTVKIKPILKDYRWYDFMYISQNKIMAYKSVLISSWCLRWSSHRKHPSDERTSRSAESLRF